MSLKEKKLMASLVSLKLLYMSYRLNSLIRKKNEINEIKNDKKKTRTTDNSIL